MRQHVISNRLRVGIAVVAAVAAGVTAVAVVPAAVARASVDISNPPTQPPGPK
jgi:hypothetical protein